MEKANNCAWLSLCVPRPVPAMLDTTGGDFGLLEVVALVVVVVADADDDSLLLDASHRCAAAATRREAALVVLACNKNPLFNNLLCIILVVISCMYKVSFWIESNCKMTDLRLFVYVRPIVLPPTRSSWWFSLSPDLRNVDFCVVETNEVERKNI